MVRVLPEKTLEHWVSMHLARRFPNARLWWPTRDEDVRVEDLSGPCGKSVLLELKTPDESATGDYSIGLDVGQLSDHARRPIPTYYVWPVPRFRGSLALEVRTHGLHLSEIGIRSRSGSLWFGNWLHVYDASSLHAWTGRQNPRFSKPKGGRIMLRINTPREPPISCGKWPTFLDDLQRCSPLVPAAFTVSFEASEPTNDELAVQLRYGQPFSDAARTFGFVDDRYTRLEPGTTLLSDSKTTQVLVSVPAIDLFKKSTRE